MGRPGTSLGSQCLEVLEVQLRERRPSEKIGKILKMSVFQYDGILPPIQTHSIQGVFFICKEVHVWKLRVCGSIFMILVKILFT